MDETSNIVIRRIPTKEGLDETLKIFNSKMQEAGAKRAELCHTVEPWSPFKEIPRDDVQNGKS